MVAGDLLETLTRARFGVEEWRRGFMVFVGNFFFGGAVGDVSRHD